MEDENCKLLFEYLRSILYDAKIQMLPVEQLDEPYQKLGKGLQFLQSAVEEMKMYSADISKGNLSGQFPGRDNFLCENLKNIHANLSHLTWQAKQVSSGDYSQHVSYLGEFSEAFNLMIKQLREREAQLTEEAEREKKRAVLMESYNELLIELTRRSGERITVVDSQTKQVIYCSQRPTTAQIGEKMCCCMKGHCVCGLLPGRQGDEPSRMWEAEDTSGGDYHITTVSIQWRGRSAYAHIVKDVTEEKRMTAQLTDKAYHDALTGIGNRRYFEESIRKLLEEQKPFSFCYLDLDHLKYINDKFGHLEGDFYICYIVSAIEKNIRQNDIFARIGGDEFCVIYPGWSKATATKKMEEILRWLHDCQPKDYPISFSYGIIEVDGGETMSCRKIMERADEIMYRYKRVNRKKYEQQLK